MNASSLSSPALSPLAFPVARADASRKAAPTPTQPRPGDTVELSPQAQSLARDPDAPIRLDLVNRVRQQIASGTYENPARLEIAALKLRRELLA